MTELDEMKQGEILEKDLQAKLKEIEGGGLVNVVHLNGQKIIACVNKSFITFVAQDQKHYALGLALFSELGFTRMENPSQQNYGYVAVLKRSWIRFLMVQTFKVFGRVLCKLRIQRRVGTEMITAGNQRGSQGQLVPGAGA